MEPHSCCSDFLCLLRSLVWLCVSQHFNNEYLLEWSEFHDKIESTQNSHTLLGWTWATPSLSTSHNITLYLWRVLRLCWQLLPQTHCWLVFCKSVLVFICYWMPCMASQLSHLSVPFLCSLPSSKHCWPPLSGKPALVFLLPQSFFFPFLECSVVGILL